MCDATDSDAVEELSDEADAYVAHRDSFHSSMDDDDDDDMPRKLIVTQVPDAVFEEQQAKLDFEALFLNYESSAQFHYLKKFRRARVEFESADSASHARSQLYEFLFMGSTIKCYFAQSDKSTRQTTSQYLEPPQPHRQFLISPPGSPPDGWEPVNERAPAINYDLITAIANMAPAVNVCGVNEPGETHEVQAASMSQPGIVVHVCDDPQNFKKHPKIVPTRAPQAPP